MIKDLYKALWGKTLFFVGTCALIVAGANSEINPAAVEAAIQGARVRCDGAGVVYFPQARILVLDGAVYRFPAESVKGRFPGRVEMRDAFSGESFLVRADQGWMGQARYSFDQVTNPNFKIRLLDCEAYKDVM